MSTEKKEDPKKDVAADKKKNKKQSVTELLAQEDLVSSIHTLFNFKFKFVER